MPFLTGLPQGGPERTKTVGMSSDVVEIGVTDGLHDLLRPHFRWLSHFPKGWNPPTGSGFQSWCVFINFALSA